MGNLFRSTKTESAERKPGYALFVSVPLIGHINPLLPQAEELARRGWRVALASTQNVRGHIERQSRGVEFVDLGPPGPIADRIKESEADLSLDPTGRRATLKIAASFVEGWPLMYDALCASIKECRPDVMIVNLVSFAGMDAADKNGIPFVVNNPYLIGTLPASLLPPADDLPILMSGRSRTELGLRDRIEAPLIRMASPHLLDLTMGRKLNALRRTRGRAPVSLSEALKDRLILTTAAFGLDYSRPLPPLIHMVGPMIPAPEPLPPEYKAWIESGPPVVYANLGTLAKPPRELLLRVLSGLESDSFRVLWVLKKELRDLLSSERIPANVRIEPWVPSTVAVLSHDNVRAFISHCGVNSVHESLYAGTPIVGIPILAGQRDTAARVRDAGVGLTLDKTTLTGAELRSAILRVLKDDSFRKPIPAIQSSFQLAGGPARAADLIEHLVAVGIDHYTRGWRPHR